mmetsp:Transcript_41131/g.36457  ORF Transcript_41131/g.36457 Transcript_41131/m.36457 type:complete len:124 (-) Transcript_41131:866-1237(-)
MIESPRSEAAGKIRKKKLRFNETAASLKMSNFRSNSVTNEEIEKIFDEDKKKKRELDNKIFNGDKTNFFSLNEDNKLVRDSKTPPALKNARLKRFKGDLMPEFRRDVSPMIVNFFDEYDTRVI